MVIIFPHGISTDKILNLSKESASSGQQIAFSTNNRKRESFSRKQRPPSNSRDSLSLRNNLDKSPERWEIEPRSGSFSLAAIAVIYAAVC